MEMKKLVNYHCEKQIQIDTQAAPAIGKIRDIKFPRQIEKKP